MVVFVAIVPRGREEKDGCAVIPDFHFHVDKGGPGVKLVFGEKGEHFRQTVRPIDNGGLIHLPPKISPECIAAPGKGNDFPRIQPLILVDPGNGPVGIEPVIQQVKPHQVNGHAAFQMDVETLQCRLNIQGAADGRRCLFVENIFIHVPIALM